MAQIKSPKEKRRTAGTDGRGRTPGAESQTDGGTLQRQIVFRLGIAAVSQALRYSLYFHSNRQCFYIARQVMGLKSKLKMYMSLLSSYPDDICYI